MREVGPGDVRTITELWHAVLVRDCVTTTAASIARYYPFAGLRFVPLADVDACETAVALRNGEPDPLVDFFVSTAKRVARQRAGILHGDLSLIG